jgi:hypothetical protein
LSPEDEKNGISGESDEKTKKRAAEELLRSPPNRRGLSRMRKRAYTALALAV